MPSQLAIVSRRRLLSKLTKDLEMVLGQHKQQRLETINITAVQGKITPTFVKEILQQLEEGVGALEKLERLLREFAMACEQTHSTFSNVEEEFEKYSNPAEEAPKKVLEYQYVW
ncbi:hypothetical protein KIN20_008272 [Parelaphostrongylus tenuis]|uniref:Uncharacterized protein n=1 Tax=Parelaphostrongylus tenuis TaxID=148309 RepID=A0AAD5MQ91_PARTN|nr:hypothetical protein KIN20_008272 [Parelaphostrongylus tenuis]